MNEIIQSDVLIIGTGLAGGIAALELADRGIFVTIVSRGSDLKDSNSYYAQGGIAFRGINDYPSTLAQDIMRAGANYCNPKAVSILAEEGPALVRHILIHQLDVPFDRTSRNELAFAREGGHSVSRILHTADVTGKSIMGKLIQKLKSHPRIQVLTNHTAIDLLTPSHHSRKRRAIYDEPSCSGAYLFDQKNNRTVRCLAKQTILATGGLGQIYLQTTNPSPARGDGLAMAYRAGARVINNEFIQFHPTTFSDQQAPNFLISEAVRGAGARLVDQDGKPFMQKYNSDWKDLAPRDIVSRSIYQEMINHEVPHMYLDLHSYIPAQTIRDKFPNIYESCLAYGVDISEDLVPVVPAAHYACGGVWTDEHGQTTIKSLYAIGEVACTGVHGANRLASTSLLEGLVWAKRSAEKIQNEIIKVSPSRYEDIPPWVEAGHEEADSVLIRQDMNVIKHILWNYVGLIRTSPRLERAMRELRNLETEIEQFYRVSRISDDLIGLRNMVRSAILVTSAAWENKSSIGCHYRE